MRNLKGHAAPRRFVAPAPATAAAMASRPNDWGAERRHWPASWVAPESVAARRERESRSLVASCIAMSRLSLALVACRPCGRPTQARRRRIMFHPQPLDATPALAYNSFAASQPAHTSDIHESHANFVSAPTKAASRKHSAGPNAMPLGELRHSSWSGHARVLIRATQWNGSRARRLGWLAG